MRSRRASKAAAIPDAAMGTKPNLPTRLEEKVYMTCAEDARRMPESLKWFRDFAGWRLTAGRGRVLNGDGTSATPSRSKRKWGGGTHGITDMDLCWTHRRLACGPGYERRRIRSGHRHRAGHAGRRCRGLGVRFAWAGRARIDRIAHRCVCRRGHSGVDRA